MNINRVTVFGGGTLGAQAALQFALYGKQVTVLGRSDNSLEKALSRIRAYSKNMRKKRPSRLKKFSGRRKASKFPVAQRKH